MKRRALPPTPSRGVALPLVLVLLLTTALMAAMAARRSASVDTIVHNTRLRMTADADAQAALRACVTRLTEAVSAAAPPPDPGPAALRGPDDPNARWRRLSHWPGGAAPGRCLTEALPDGRYLITARGLSGASAVDPASGALRGLTGGEAWWQAIVGIDRAGRWQQRPYPLLQPPS